VLLLDEPTAVLTPDETEELLTLLRQFAACGGSAVLITHKLGEIISIVDRVTVLRRGKVTFSGPAAGQTSRSLAAAMVGGHEGTREDSNRIEETGPIVARAGELEVRQREIVGIAAVEGNGQRELLQSLAGLGPNPVAVEGAVAFIPEDRTTEGLIPTFTLTENVVLGLPDDPRWRRGVWIRWDSAEKRTDELLAEFDIRASGPGAETRTLSGGNQQKLVFARALDAGPRLLVAENPTRGLDVHATRFVHDRLRAAASAGAGVVVYSTDLDEVIELADRVLVMYRGSLTAVEPGADRDRLSALLLGTAR
jgi:simple sugar transport system ATP-binding protein